MPKHPPPFVSLVCDHFKDLPDPRIERTRLHSLLNVVMMALSCVIAGADGWDAMAAFAKLNKKWFEGFLDLPAGVPSADTFRRVLSSLEPRAFEKCFRELVTGLAQSLEGEVVAIDGKALRGAIHKAGSKTPLHLWATKLRLLLSQRAVTRVDSSHLPAPNASNEFVRRRDFARRNRYRTRSGSSRGGRGGAGFEAAVPQGPRCGSEMSPRRRHPPYRPRRRVPIHERVTEDPARRQEIMGRAREPKVGHGGLSTQRHRPDVVEL
jgi:hypothetical protein